MADNSAINLYIYVEFFIYQRFAGLFSNLSGEWNLSSHLKNNLSFGMII